MSLLVETINTLFGSFSSDLVPIQRCLNVYMVLIYHVYTGSEVWVSMYDFPYSLNAYLTSYQHSIILYIVSMLSLANVIHHKDTDISLNSILATPL